MISNCFETEKPARVFITSAKGMLTAPREIPHTRISIRTSRAAVRKTFFPERYEEYGMSGKLHHHQNAYY